MVRSSTAAQPLRLFYSYSHEDERMRRRLEAHLKLLEHQGLISTWHFRKIGAGEEWKGAIDRNLAAADIVLLLISASFLASRYCYDVEMTRALRRHKAGRARVIPVILRDHASCHTSAVSERALAERAAWLHPIWLAKYSPHLNEKEREWRYLKRDARGHLARDLRAFVDEIVDGLDRLGGEERLIIDAVPQWFLDGHRKAPTGRKAGRPVGSKDGKPRKPRTKRANLPTPT